MGRKVEYRTIGGGEVEKRCTTCMEFKTLEMYSKEATGSFGRRAKCRECISKQAAIENNTPEAIMKRKERNAKLSTDEEYKKKRSISAKIRNKRPEVIERRREQQRQRQAWDPNYMCRVTMHNLLARSLRSLGLKKVDLTFVALGYAPDQLRQRLECQFQPGMTWQNHGRHGWHIDHKKPMSAFLAQGVTDPKTINALCNLQPLWAEENMAKKATWAPLVAANDNIKIGAVSAA